MALSFCFDLNTFLERTCRACSRYFDEDADVKVIFHRIFNDGSGSFSLDADGNSNEKPTFNEIIPHGDVLEIFEEFKLWQLNIQPIDGLPQQICHECLERFRNVKNFREECLDTQKVLQSYFKDLDGLSQTNSLGKISPRTESVKSETRASSSSPCGVNLNADHLVEIVPVSPERLTHLSPCNSPKFQLSPRNVYAESSMGTPPPLFEEIKTEPIDMQTMDYMKSEADLLLEMAATAQVESTTMPRKSPPMHYVASDDESSTPTSDDDIGEEDDDDDEEEADTDLPEVIDLMSVTSSNLSPSNPLQCRICYVVFSKRALLKEHHKHMHPQEKPFVCNICGSAFKSNFLLKQHKLKHNRPDSIKCALCEKYFRSQLHLQRHEKNFHLTSTYTCHICHEKFENYTQLRFQYHVRQHGEKRFQCQTCEKSFHQKIHLINHERTHTKEQPFRCNLCGKAYRQQTACQEHMLTHDDPTPFKCEICQKGFTQRSSLRLHYRRHSENGARFVPQKPFQPTLLQHDQNPTELKNRRRTVQRYKKRVKTASLKKMHSNHKVALNTFKCSFCDITFASTQLQSLHEQKYHKQLLHFTCSFCPEQFINRAQLGAHMISHLDSETFDDEDTDYNFQMTL